MDGRELCEKVNCRSEPGRTCVDEILKKKKFACELFGSCHVHILYLCLAKCPRGMYIVYSKSNTACTYHQGTIFEVYDDLETASDVYNTHLEYFPKEEEKEKLGVRRCS